MKKMIMVLPLCFATTVGYAQSVQKNNGKEVQQKTSEGLIIATTATSSTVHVDLTSSQPNYRVEQQQAIAAPISIDNPIRDAKSDKQNAVKENPKKAK